MGRACWLSAWGHSISEGVVWWTGEAKAQMGVVWQVGRARTSSLRLPRSPTTAEDPAYTPRECFQRISRRLRTVLKRSRIPMVSTGVPGLAFLPAWSFLKARFPGTGSHPVQVVSGETGQDTGSRNRALGRRAGATKAGTVECVGVPSAEGTGRRWLGGLKDS